ncbi:hypothetical protein [Intestinimonas sp. HCP28S3_D6]|uniref:hypothetical protein n=1 Tax=Intestinimonas sp. HCP28S3_D6 TaxID=3438942 RepID=UPI003F88BE5B
MERKNKLVLFLLIVLVMTVALISSFGLNIFAGKGAEIVLPTPDTTASGEDEGLEGGGQVLPVRTTPETVQNIISTLTRPENYARTVTVEMTTGTSQAGSFTANVLVDGAWTSIELTQSFQPMGTQYTIVYTNPESGEGTLYRWYAGSTEVKSWPVGESGADLAQHIPTYEDVLELDQESIVDANYVTRDGVPCIYVETSVDELGYLERYWVSTGNGLLIASETVKDDVVIMRMRSTDAEVLQAAEKDRFTLPDGTVLYEQTTP